METFRSGCHLKRKIITMNVVYIVDTKIWTSKLHLRTSVNL